MQDDFKPEDLIKKEYSFYRSKISWFVMLLSTLVFVLLFMAFARPVDFVSLGFRELLFATLGMSVFVMMLSYLQDRPSKNTAERDEKAIALKLTNKDKQELLSSLQNDFLDKTSNDIFSTLYHQIESKLKNFSEVTVAESVFKNTRERLANEIESLKKRGNFNLALGVMIAIAGVTILWKYVLGNGIVYTNENILPLFLPRLTLVILIEAFAYFFLRLYKSSLDETKFFHNELTNIDAHLTAMQLSFADKKPEERLCVITSLAKTERNPIVEKGKSKLIAENDNDSTIELIKTIADVVLKKEK